MQVGHLWCPEWLVVPTELEVPEKTRSRLGISGTDLERWYSCCGGTNALSQSGAWAPLPHTEGCSSVGRPDRVSADPFWERLATRRDFALHRCPLSPIRWLPNPATAHPRCCRGGVCAYSVPRNSVTQDGAAYAQPQVV